MELEKNDMKITYADRPNWSRVLAKSFAMDYVTRPDFTGYLSMILIEQVREPLIVTTLGKQYRLADAGYIWLQHFPKGLNYALTSIFNPNFQLIQCYFDICKSYRVSASGMPYFEDLYLDIVLLPTGEIVLLDEDELIEALAKQVITQQEYDLAYSEAKKLIVELENKENKLINNSQADLQYMFDLLK